FARMAMDDAETVALIAGGHSFGKTHGAHPAGKCLQADPAGSAIEEQGLGWNNKCGKGHSEDTVTSGLEGAWTASPTKWSMQYLETLFAFDWVKTKSPAGAIQWVPSNKGTEQLVADAHVKGKRVKPVMLTTDVSLKFDPAYEKISKQFLENPKEFEKAFARAWFKLTHRDMGPRARYVGSDVPKEVLTWQDPIPAVTHKTIGKKDIAKLKKQILATDISVPALVRTAWSAASSFRGTDMRGGANGARVALAPQKNWPANSPKELSMVIAKLKDIQSDFNRGSKKVSLADLIVIAGAAAIEKAAGDAGYKITVPVIPGRGDATQAQTDVASFAALEPKADGFRNFYDASAMYTPTFMLIDKANMLNLTVPEMTVLVGGLRVLNANTEGLAHGVLTDAPGRLSNDFFVHLLDMRTLWTKSAKDPSVYQGVDRQTGQQRWTATPVDLAFGSSSELRAIAEVYAADDGQQKFVDDFVTAWTKVMRLDRFDI
ncbi:MAG: catalase-peroxidase, partial [Deltaproteobacteria bacterium]|nr:catalase-peroxidase [Deltaproteobacteria bacterium]